MGGSGGMSRRIQNRAVLERATPRFATRPALASNGTAPPATSAMPSRPVSSTKLAEPGPRKSSAARAGPDPTPTVQTKARRRKAKTTVP